MKLVGRLKERRQRKAHQRYLAEREHQKELSEQDTAKAIRDTAVNWGAAGQAGMPPN